MEFYKSKYSDKKKSNRNGNRKNEPSRSFRNSGDDSRDESTTVTCADCGTECQVPFVPRTNKPVYCSDCFRQNKPQDSGSDRGSRYSRDDRGSRYSRDDRGSRYSRDDRGSRYSRDDRGSRYSRDDRGSRYSRDDRGSRYSRDDRGSRYSRDDRGSRYSRDDSRDESTTVTCADCGTECQVPFVPRTNKPVYCSDCFRQNKPQDSGSDRGSRYSRDDRDSSSFGRESRKDRSNSGKTRSDKFLRKQESFYSNGSDKFYETIKEKLYEILGGKICSSCGFKDERALGISPISDLGNSGSDGRGGNVASWGKYISAPDLAREELKVFCLNCNEIREPVAKSRQDRSSSKKSKYFPR